MKISAAANVEVPAILALEAMGYTVASKVVSNDYEMVWRATCDGQEYVGEDPLSLLGLVKLLEVRGNNWQASDDEITQYLPMLQGDT